ncbi:hypothetical protein I551_5986 [Mycobacterium ulcerans str. Harvey]|uniref:Uncharacterized protein n=1 Tax=Mycobacterium ulcerans str. Harvey TaxID=1299332 RepID=A0ABN0QSD9_MYCUL|nr:hypothetical protein I551_5986 [Mycobacterium ulcerans str. Harvey]
MGTAGARRRQRDSRARAVRDRHCIPEYRTDPLGFGEHRVGMAKFMQRLNSVLPLWLQYGGSPAQAAALCPDGVGLLAGATA